MLPLISLTLGLAFLGGLNLYLTTFLASLAISWGWAGPVVSPALEVVGHPAVMIIALILFVVEFVVDKIPWVDSFWDFFHTLIRPAGALGISLVAANAAGLTTGPTIALGLASVVFALSSHLTKSGLRLIINASPEPFTNILASLVEDLGVCLLAFLLFKAPVTGLAASLSLLVGTWIVLPRLGRLVKTSSVLLWKKYLGPRTACGLYQGPLPTALTVAQETQLAGLLNTTQPRARWSVPCASGKAHGLPGHRAHWSGTLISPAGHPGTLVFLTQGWFRPRGVRFSLAGASVRQESTFLSENLIIHRVEDGLHLVFRFTRAEAPIVTRLTGQLHTQLGITAPIPTIPARIPAPPSSSNQVMDNPERPPQPVFMRAE